MTAMLSNGDLAGAAVLQPDLARAADDAGRDHLRARVTQMQAALHFWSGELKQSTVILKQLVSANCYDNSGDKLELIDERFADLVLLSKCQWMLGSVDDAISTCAECCEGASRARHKISLAYSLSYAGCRLAILTGDFALAEQRLDDLSEQASLDPGGQWGLMKQCWEGVLRNRQGDAELAMSLLGPALEVIPTGSFALHQTRFLGEYALARARSGDAVEGARLVRAALATCARTGERWFLSELLRIKGEIALLTGCLGSVSAARADFESALEMGRQQHALSSQLRAANSIVKIARGPEEAALAAENLARVYDRFTQGFLHCGSSRSTTRAGIGHCVERPSSGDLTLSRLGELEGRYRLDRCLRADEFGSASDLPKRLADAPRLIYVRRGRRTRASALARHGASGRSFSRKGGKNPREPQTRTTGRSGTTAGRS